MLNVPFLLFQVMLRKGPKRNAFLGVHWTQWPWPSMVARAIWRRYMPKPADATSPFRKTMERRLALVYLMCGWSMLCLVLFWPSQKPTLTEEEQRRMEEEEKHGLSWVKNLVHRKDLEEGHRVIHFKMAGLKLEETYEVSSHIHIIYFKHND